jgi:FAD-linked sulfhydryl oxidase
MVSFANPDVWGSSAWVFLHSVSNTFPDSPTSLEKKNYILFFYSLAEILPCKLCRSHYKEWLRLYPVDKFVSSQKKMNHWVFLMHNYVNLRLKKKLMKNSESCDEAILDHAKKNMVFSS